MTKRAGKRKHRMGSQRHPPGKKTAPSTLIEDNLPESASHSLEKQAINGDWLCNSEEADKLRQALIQKMMAIALKSPDEKTAVSAFRAVAMAELRQQALNRGTGLPSQVNVGVGVNIEQPEEKPAEVRPLDIVQELLKRADVLAAVTGESVGKE